MHTLIDPDPKVMQDVMVVPSTVFRKFELPLGKWQLTGNLVGCFFLHLFQVSHTHIPFGSPGLAGYMT